MSLAGEKSPYEARTCGVGTRAPERLLFSLRVESALLRLAFAAYQLRQTSQVHPIVPDRIGYSHTSDAEFRRQEEFTPYRIRSSMSGFSK